MSTKDIKKDTKPQEKQKTPRAELGKKPYWYLFLLANLIVVIGCTITFAYMYKGSETNNMLYLATLICNVAAVIPAGFFVWLELKDISPQIMHFQRKWLKFYVISAAFFVVAIIFNALFFCICGQKQEFLPGGNQKWVWIIYLVITAVLSLVSIGFQRYARYRIDLDVYRRKHGEEIKQKEDEEKAKKEALKDQKPKEVKDSDIKVPSGGLIDQMDK